MATMMQATGAGIGWFVGEQLRTATPGGWAAAGACALAVLVLAGAGVWLAAMDITEHRLPRRIVWPLYPVTTALFGVSAALSDQHVRWWWMLWGFAIMGGLFALLRLVYPAGMGLGDVRLAGVLGLATGFGSVWHTLLALLLTFVLAGTVCVVLIAGRRITMSTRVAFGPFMLLGSLGVIAFG